MKFVIQADSGKALLEYNPEDVRKMFNELLKKVSFDEAWDIIVSGLKNKTGRL